MCKSYTRLLLPASAYSCTKEMKAFSLNSNIPKSLMPSRRWALSDRGFRSDTKRTQCPYLGPAISFIAP